MFVPAQRTSKNKKDFLIQNMSRPKVNFNAPNQRVTQNPNQKIHFSIPAARNQASAALSRRGAHFLPMLEFCANSMRRFLLPTLLQPHFSCGTAVQKHKITLKTSIYERWFREGGLGGRWLVEEATTTRPSKPAASASSAEQARARRHLQNPLLLQCLSTTLCTIYR